MPKLSNQFLQEKVFNNTLQTCDYISGYETAKSIIKIKCRKHNYEFETKWENVRRDNRSHHVCPYCQEEDKNAKYEQDRFETECAYCHEKIIRHNSDLKTNKSGLFFCCREHKDLAQRLSSGEEFSKMRPAHYDNGKASYREIALRFYPHECSVCGYKEEEDILQIHHIDEDRSNNNLDNLIVLCPNCHAKITFANYKLLNRQQLIKLE